MNKFLWGAAFGFMLAVILHSYGLLKTIPVVL